MSQPASVVRPSVIPCLRYRDAPQAIDWLCATSASSGNWSLPMTTAESPTRSWHWPTAAAW